MCGIIFTASRLGQVDLDHELVDSVNRRGPDSNNQLNFVVKDWNIMLHSSVLHLRGPKTVSQPVKNDRFILQWNGEIFDGPFDGLSFECDTLMLFKALQSSSSVVETIASIRGPFALVLVDLQREVVYYARDLYGRRSLLKIQTNDSLTLASVALDGAEEVDTKGIYEYYFNSGETHVHSWDSLGLYIPRLNSSIDPLIDLKVEDLMSLLEEFSKSLKKRLLSIPDLQSARIGILFSGGIDSLLMAAGAHLVLPESIAIDLVNVAFSADDSFEAVPDRQSGRLAFAELCQKYPNRSFTLHPINVTKKEYEEKMNHVSMLAAPNDSVMDKSIAIALWFSAERAPLDCRVLLLGMGADEQFGGYSRHAMQFKSGSWPSLLSEMQMDVDRIASRNLGRDERIISDHGREARYPFLDEQFIEFVSNLPLHFKCDPRLPRGQGEKRMLRELGLTLGFSSQLCYTPKRAIQFGARTAKMQDDLTL